MRQRDTGKPGPSPAKLSAQQQGEPLLTLISILPCSPGCGVGAPGVDLNLMPWYIPSFLVPPSSECADRSSELQTSVGSSLLENPYSVQQELK